MNQQASLMQNSEIQQPKEKENRKLIQKDNRKVFLMGSGASDRNLIKNPPMSAQVYSEKKQSIVTPQHYTNSITINQGLKISGDRQILQAVGSNQKSSILMQ